MLREKTKKRFDHEIFFLTDLNHICMREAVTISYGSHVLPSPPRPLKRPNNFNLLFAFSNFYFVGLPFRAHVGYGYTSRAEAILLSIQSTIDSISDR